MKVQSNKTFEGAISPLQSSHQILDRTVSSCLLWEDSFYESGESVANRIKRLVPLCDPEFVAGLAIKARKDLHLRHVPLLLIRELARNKTFKVSKLIYDVIQRPDELGELLAIYWKDGRTPIANQVKKGLRETIRKFSSYQIIKYKNHGTVKIRDVICLVRPEPLDEDQETLWKGILDKSTKHIETWETMLSEGKDKKETFEMLIKENKLGGLAILRNIRNMQQCGVDVEIIKTAIYRLASFKNILPFRYVAAANENKEFSSEIFSAMVSSINNIEKILGNTIILVDVSASMDYVISRKSNITRISAAASLAIIAKKYCENIVIMTFSEKLIIINNETGFRLYKLIIDSQDHSTTKLGLALHQINIEYDYDRIIVITDEQTSDDIPNPEGIGYMINIADYANGIAHGNWIKINGFSENVIKFILELEKK